MAARGQHQCGNELPRIPHFRHDGKSVLAGKHHIEYDDIEAGGSSFQNVEGRFAGIGHLDLMAFGFQVEAQAVGKVQLVFHYQDATHLDIGSCSTKVLPRPGPSLSAQARPPCRLATERTMYRPSPVPGTRGAAGPRAR